MILRYVIMLLLGFTIGIAYLVVGTLILIILGALINIDIMQNDTVFYLLLLVSFTLGGADADREYLNEQLKYM